MRIAAGILLLCCSLQVYAQSSGAVQSTTSLETQENLSASSATDFLIFTGEVNHLRFANVSGNGGDNDGGNSGRNGSLDWVHADQRGRTFTAGVSAFSLEADRWAYGKMGGAFRTRKEITIEGQVQIGGGHSGGAPFTHQVYSAGAIYPASKHLYLKLNEKFLRIAGTHGHLLTPGVTFLPTRRLAVDLSYSHSAAGNFKTEFAAVRLDFTSGKMEGFGGLAIGDSIPETVNLRPDNILKNQPIREGFVGMTVPVAGARLSVISDFLSLGSTRRRAMTLSLKVPLRRQRIERR